MATARQRWLAWCCLGFLGCAGTTTVDTAEPLRVGTTGDFAPFSMATPGGVVGIDIDMARDLGRDLGRPVEFVRTTWPSLLTDANAHRFDVALSGISITPPRTLEVDFSSPYTQHDRVAIVRCSESDRFLTFEDLDQSGVTVSTLRGGASAAYIRAHFRRATVRLVEDVESLLPMIVAGVSDAAITPPYAVRRHHGLCTGLQGQHFFSTPVAVLLPKRSPLMKPVNAWLERRLQDGTVVALLDHYSAR